VGGKGSKRKSILEGKCSEEGAGSQASKKQSASRITEEERRKGGRRGFGCFE